MSDFVAHIVAQLDASKAEAQLQALTKKRVVDIEFNITNDLNSAFQKQFGGSGRSGNFSKLGQQAGQTYAKGFYRGYFKDQKWVADQAKVLEKQFPKARENAQASSFYKNAVKARDKEIARQQREEERQLAEGRKAADQQYKYLNNRELSYQKQRAKYIEQGRKQEQAVIRQNQQQVENYARRYGNGKYEADFAVMQSQLEKYGNQSTPGMEKANEALEKYKTTLSQIKQHFDPNEVCQFDKDSDLVNAFDDLDNAAERYKNAMREVGVETTKALKPGQNIQKSNSILEYYNNNSKAIKKYGAELKQLAMEAQNATTVGELDDINQRFNTLKSTISAEGLTGRSIFSEIGRGFKQIAQFVGTYGLIKQIPQTIMKMAGETIKVDSAITELRKVSDASDAELANSFTKATAAAKEYGVAISDVIASTADWKRLGYTLDEAEQLADATTLLQRVGDNMTQESASQAIISTMRGFQLETDQVGRVVDLYNEIANREPIDTAGMAEAIERSASSMSAAGNTLEETMGLIAAANSVVQDPKSIGRALPI